MTGAITINLPLKPYLVKYLIKKYGDYHIINKSSWLGIYFIDLLDKQYRKRGNIKDGTFYKLIVPGTIIKDVGFDMPAAKYNKLEQMIDKLFRNDLYNYVELVLEHNLHVPVSNRFKTEADKVFIRENAIKALKQFFKSYQITEDDLKLESIYRDFNRYKNKNRTDIENAKNKTV